MEGLTICYEFNFNIAVKKKNGREYKSYAVLATGINYDQAVWDAYFTLKKRRIAILKINSAKVLRIAFALDDNHNFITAKLADHPIEIPADLDKILNQLPKKNVV